MDPQRMKEAYEKLQSLDDRMTHKVRPRASLSATRGNPEQIEAALRDLATYTIELKEVVHELFLAIAGSRPNS